MAAPAIQLTNIATLPFDGHNTTIPSKAIPTQQGRLMSRPESEQSRYIIPAEVRRQLARQSRGRCCLCRALIVPGQDRIREVAAVLENHHIVFFSSGGGQTAKNLLVVDPTCHALIHQDRKKYSNKMLRAARTHWVEMARQVPKEILYTGSSAALASSTINLVRLPFVLESVGLSFTLTVPDSITVHSLLELIKRQILVPLGKYDDNEAWRNPERIRLSQRSNTNSIFDEARLLSSITLTGQDAFTVLVHQPVVARTVGPPNEVDTPTESLLRLLRAEPTHPVAGQRYRVIFETPDTERRVVEVSIQGTDGFSRQTTGTAEPNAPFTLEIPGGRAGVVDTITARSGRFSPKIVLVFLPP
jgi:hypothetical protein